MTDDELRLKLTEALAQVRSLREQLGQSQSASKSERNLAIIERARVEPDKAKIAAEFGLHRLTIYEILKKSGERFPRKPGSGRPRDVETHNKVVDHFRSCRSLPKTGEAFGVSRERVRQIVACYERETGEGIPRGYGRGNQYSERITWRCADCGEERIYTAGVIAFKGKRCMACALRKSRLSDEKIDEWLRRRRAGESWYSIGVSEGYSKRATHQITRAVYSALLRRGRDDLIAEIWPGGAPPWLMRLFPQSQAAE